MQLKGRFPVSSELFKQRIEQLIEQEYLERSAEDRTIFNYKA